MNNSTFEILNAVNVNEHTEKKNGLTYLSWAWAWAELLKHCPDATYTVYENAQGWNYHTDGRTCWVKTGVTVAGREYIEMLPVMDFKNRSIELAAVTSTDVNKAIQRSLTKAVARHGLGLYIYAGEDIPETAEEMPADEKPRTEATLPRTAADKPRATVTIVSPSPVPAPVITMPEAVPSPVPAAADASAHPRSRTDNVRELCRELNISEDQFGRLKKMAIWSNTIPAEKVSALTDEQFTALIDYVRRNWRLSA